MSFASWLRSLKSATQGGRKQRHRPSSPRRRRTTHKPTLEQLEELTLLSTFTVLNTLDSGVGSLRQAILDANANTGADLINFNIGGGGTQTIAPTSALPTITDPLVIDGTTQPGYAGTPLIELNGSGAGAGTNGLTISAGNSTVRGLVINRFATGIRLETNGGNIIEGNYVGTNATGMSAIGGGGVSASSNANRIGTNGDGVNDAAERNVIVGGCSIGGQNNVVAGNFIGTNATGTARLGGSLGVSGNSNRIGTNGDGVADTAERNVIVGNLSTLSGSNHVVAGNFIGTDVTGTLALGPFTGLEITGTGNRIGTDGNGINDAAERNLISGNADTGLRIDGSFNVVAGNYIGTDVTGTLAVPNGGGVSLLFGARSNRIERNLISGNGEGVNIGFAGTDSNVVASNYIGTDVTGTRPLGNSHYGVAIWSSDPVAPRLNRIGTDGDGVNDAAERNVISANGWAGVNIRDNAADNVVAGNYIGTDATGTQPLGNLTNGVEIAASGNIVGGTAPGTGNVIAYNGNSGIQIISGTGNSVRRNAIFANTGMGINLAGGVPGVTPNDAGDADGGTNGMQNYPVLYNVGSTGGQTTVSGLLDSTPNTAFTVEFFSSALRDGSGYGEGQTYLGSAQVTTNASGYGSFTAVVAGMPAGHRFLTATATHSNGSTSEFSAALLATGDVVGTVQMPFTGTLTAAVYDASGQIIRTLYETALLPAGPVELRWDGTNDFDIPMAPGQYHWRTTISQARAVDDGQVGERASVPYGPGEHSAFVTAVAVDAAGNVYESSFFEESLKELRKWDAAGNALWSYELVGSGVVAVDDTYVYTTHATGGQLRVVRVRAADGVSAPWTSLPQGYLVINPSTSLGVFGLAVDATRLWVSNHGQNRIEIYDKASGALLGQFAVTAPRGIATDGSGNAWVAHGGDRVVKFSAAGTVLASITGLNNPYAVALGGPTNRLFVGDIGASKVREYDPVALTQVRELFGAAQPGPISPYAFYWKTMQTAGLAVDSLGRMIVADVGNKRVLTFNPDGTHLRTRFSEFQPAPFTDPSVDPRMLLSTWFEYQVDYTPGPTYGQWTVANNWLPADKQYYSAQSVIRRLPNGQRYLFYFGVEAGVAVYQLDGPSGMRRSAIVGGTNGLWNWTDSDGDGQVETPETVQRDPYTGYPYYENLSPGWWIDGSGNAYIASWLNGVSGSGISTVKVPLLGFDALGNPRYDWANRQTVVAADVGGWQFQPTNLRVDPANNNLYRVGTTVLNRNFDPFWMGGTAVERLAPDGTRLNVIPISPATTSPVLVAIATDTDGNYFYTGHAAGDQLWVRMYTNDGMLVATGYVGPNNGSGSGWIDHGLGLTAFTHPVTGTHYAYAEDVYWGKSIRFRIDQLNTLQRSNGTFSWTSDPDLVVTNTNDGGPGSLRHAIVGANFRNGPDVIRFNIPGTGVRTIRPLSPLPTIIDRVTIDGATQPGFAGTPLIELNGSGAGAGAYGLTISAGNSTVRGLVINRFAAGIRLQTNGGNVVEGNYLGTDATGMIYLGGGGISVQSNANRIGTNGDGVNDAAERNVIVRGFVIPGHNNVVAGNFIGTDVTGTRALGTFIGLEINGTGNRIGTDGNGINDAAERNLISGNADTGIGIFGGSFNVVAGNYIGTDVTGTLALGNGGGVSILFGARSNRIERNLISGNEKGVEIAFAGTDNNVLVGNYIGTDVTGTRPLGNLRYGVEIWSTDPVAPRLNRIGSDGDGVNDAAEANVISANGWGGISIRDNASDNVVAGNYIGTDVTGTQPLGNASIGVSISGAGNIVGGTVPGTGNLIAYNNGSALWIASGTGNAIRRNAIFANGGRGIDLGPGGVTANDAGDSDTGANNLQNFPVLSSAARTAGGATIQGSLNSTPSTTFTLEFFASTAADPSGYGEGQVYLGSATVTTDAAGNVSFTATVPISVLGQQYVSATATDPAGNTSEFSALVILPPNSPPTANAGGPYTVGEGGTTALAGAGSDADGDTLSYAWDLDNNGSFETAGQNPTFSAAGRDGPTSQTVVLQVSDNRGGFATSTATVTITNVAPIVAITGAPASSPEGTAINLGRTLTDPGPDTHTLAWSVTKNGSAYASAAGSTFSFTPNDNGTYVVTLTATDDDNGTGSDSKTITVTNVNPTATVTGPSDGVRGQTRTLNVAATDPSTIDQAEGFTYTINWGDGLPSQTISRTAGNGSGIAVDHIYTTTGTYSVQVTAADKDNGTSAAASLSITITATAIQPDPCTSGATQLAVGGTTGADNLVINQGSGSDAQVLLNGTSLGNFSFTGRIIVFAQAGNDDVQTAGSITRAVWGYGGDGNDRLKGGGGHDRFFGGSGDDLLVGGDGRDLLVGGLGADRIVGNPDDDILIAGSTAFDANEAALCAVMAEWTSSRDYSTRMANLSGTGSGTRANGSCYLIATGTGATVSDDGAYDVLTGSSGMDWFFAYLSGPGVIDRITDLSAAEFANDLDFINTVL